MLILTRKLVTSSEADAAAGVPGSQTAPWLVDQRVDQRQTLAGNGVAQGGADRVLRRLLQSRRQRQALRPIKRAQRQYVQQPHPAGGQGTGLVEDKVTGSRQRLDGVTARHQQAGTGHRPTRYGQRHRGGQ